MNKEQLNEIKHDAIQRLMNRRSEDGMWRGTLSSSAISTSVSIFALQSIDAHTYDSYIKAGVSWLHSNMNDDGSWGDSPESPSNMTATLLSYVSLHALGQAPEQSRQYLKLHLGGDSQEQLTKGVLRYYGRDLTFSVPILTMCALAGILTDWNKIPSFPFEFATLPQSLFRYLNLPVVSYAIPALIAIGICQMNHKNKHSHLLTPVRRQFVPKAMKLLQTMQPVDGGFLEAAPLTAFVSMCLANGGFREHHVTQQCAQFLVHTVRKDGSWPIDTNLSLWTTTLAAKVLPHDLIHTEQLANIIKQNATTSIHPFTNAAPGGWGWSDLSGSVPDGDDTSSALVALHTLTDGKNCLEVQNGIRWLMKLQNNDGGMPTFCKGWGKLPFDRSTPDITAHAILAIGLWLPSLQGKLRTEAQHSFERMLTWMERQIKHTGWTPLWFGDQDAPDEKAPVYGTATAIDYLMSAQHPRATKLAQSQITFILDTQNQDGGWGGNKGITSKVTYTSRALAALNHFPQQYQDAKQRAWNYLYQRYKTGTLYQPEPIGLYFSRLWYSEELYNILFLLNALKRINE